MSTLGIGLLSSPNYLLRTVVNKRSCERERVDLKRRGQGLTSGQAVRV